jgi:hypothetical protein
VIEGNEVKVLIEELQQLRRGYGLHAPDVLSRVGPVLTRVCGLETLSSTGGKRDRLIERIGGLVGELPDELRLAVQAAFALAPADQSRFLRERMEWLGEQLQRGPRTALRWVQSGLTLLAEQMLQLAAPSDEVKAVAGRDEELSTSYLVLGVVRGCGEFALRAELDLAEGRSVVWLLYGR